MCVVCRTRFKQEDLYRLRVNSKNLTGKNGRSAYLCENCVKKEDKILQKAFAKINKNLNITQHKLKEIFFNGKD